MSVILWQLNANYHNWWPFYFLKQLILLLLRKHAQFKLSVAGFRFLIGNTYYFQLSSDNIEALYYGRQDQNKN